MLDIAADCEIHIPHVARAGIRRVVWCREIWDWQLCNGASDEILHNVFLILALVHLSQLV